MTANIHEHAATVATKISYTASGGIAVFGVFNIGEIALIVGMLLSLATFIVNWVYREKHYRLGKASKRTRKNNSRF